MAQTLGSVAVGSIVKLNESGSPVEFYVAKHDYESGLNGAGRTLLVRRECYREGTFNSAGTNDYANGSADIWLNGTYKGLLDGDVQTAIGETTFYYTPGNGNEDVTTLERSIFILSMAELNQDEGANVNKEGTALDIAGILHFAYMNGEPAYQWTRSPSKLDNYSAWRLNPSGGRGNYNAAASFGYRPVFTLPGFCSVDDNNMVSTVLAPPATLTVPSIVMQGQGIPISWSQADGADGYILERKADSGAWAQVYSGANLSYADTAGSWSTVQYRVKAGVDGTYGDYTTSAAVQVAAASALVISGQDGSLGTVTADIPYTVSTDTGSQISLVQTVNGAQMYSGQVTSGAARSIPVMELPSGNGTIVLTATVQTSGGPVSAARTWTYNKTPISFPAAGGVAQLTKSGANLLLPKTLAEAVRTNPFWGGSLDKALDKLTRAVTYAGEQVPRYQEVTVNLPAAQEGDIVQLPEGGKLVEFYVAKLNYEQALNGAGRTLLVRKECYDQRAWDEGIVNAYASSDIDTWLNGTYKNLLGSDVQSAIGTTQFYYTPGNENKTVGTLGRSVFLLSLTELGKTASHANVEGSALPIASTLQIAYNSSGSATTQWTRSPYTGNTNCAWRLYPDGNIIYSYCTNTNGSRPAFTLPSTFTATYYVDGNGALHDAQEYDQGGDFYDLLGNVVPSVKIATGSYVGTGTYGEDNPNTLTFPFKPKVVFVCGNARAGTSNAEDGAITIMSSGVTDYIGSSVGTRDYMNAIVAWSENTVSWYADVSGDNRFYPYQQLNAAEYTYYYIALG